MELQAKSEGKHAEKNPCSSDEAGKERTECLRHYCPIKNKKLGHLVKVQIFEEKGSAAMRRGIT